MLQQTKGKFMLAAKSLHEDIKIIKAKQWNNDQWKTVIVAAAFLNMFRFRGR